MNIAFGTFWNRHQCLNWIQMDFRLKSFVWIVVRKSLKGNVRFALLKPQNNRLSTRIRNEMKWLCVFDVIARVRRTSFNLKTNLLLRKITIWNLLADKSKKKNESTIRNENYIQRHIDLDIRSFKVDSKHWAAKHNQTVLFLFYLSKHDRALIS